MGAALHPKSGLAPEPGWHRGGRPCHRVHLPGTCYGACNQHDAGEAERVAIWALSILATVLFIGGIVAGSGPDWERFPGPFLVSADARSLTQEGISAAEWASVNLGPGQRVATDRVNSVLMATYGRQRVITSLDDNIDASPLFTSLTFDDTDLNILRDAHIGYLVADLRLSTGLPRRGFYFSEAEPDAFFYTAPISRAALTKFDDLSNVNRVFDSGNIVIYDTGALLNGT
jgi:hypothetical protein